MSDPRRPSRDSRRSRHHPEDDLSTTQASFSSLSVSDRSYIAPVYAQSPHHPQVAASPYHQPEYVPSDFLDIPGNYPGNSPISPFPSEYFTPSQAMSETYMSSNYGYMPQATVPSNSSGAPYSTQMIQPPGQYPNTGSRRSMSDSFRPLLPSNTPLGPPGGQEHEMTRRRRRDRRQVRAQTRAQRASVLPSISSANLGSTQVTSGSVDFSFAASSSYSSTYVHDPIERSHSRQSIASSAARGDYNVVSGPTRYPESQYQSGYPTAMHPPTLITPGYSDHRQSVSSARGSSHSPRPVPPYSEPQVIDRRRKPQCWDHGCNGREFSTFSNLLRHQREKSGSAKKSYCPNCGAEFTRTTARNGHMEHGKCKPSRGSE